MSDFTPLRRCLPRQRTPDAPVPSTPPPRPTEPPKPKPIGVYGRRPRERPQSREPTQEETDRASDARRRAQEVTR